MITAILIWYFIPMFLCIFVVPHTISGICKLVDGRVSVEVKEDAKLKGILSAPIPFFNVFIVFIGILMGIVILVSFVINYYVKACKWILKKTKRKHK